MMYGGINQVGDEAFETEKEVVLVEADPELPPPRGFLGHT